MKIFKYFFILAFLSAGYIFLPWQNNGRPLTEAEIVELQSVFFSELNYSKIMIHQKKLPNNLTAFVLANHIVFRDQYYGADFSNNYLRMSTLIHEVCHVWANQKKGLYTSLFAIAENIFYTDQVYVHGPLLSTQTETLTDFRYEQQCRILSDYYVARYLQSDVSTYEKIIYQTIQQD